MPLLECAAGSTGGSFVELGANDGETNTNTAALESCLGWQGVLIEGNPQNFAKLEASQRNATKVHSAVCLERGSVNFSSNGGEFAADLERINVFNRVHFHRYVNLSSAASVVVPCDSLASILDSRHVPLVITFLSLDVEGAEVTVLESVDPSRFLVVLVETIIPGADKDPRDRAHNKRVAALLTDAGLKRVQELEARNHVNHVYVNGGMLSRCAPRIGLRRRRRRRKP